ncbi:nucleoside-diphosphate kinase [Streptomyces sp. BE133]|uniref:nucleoside-diphosphate kinase n=1 Tax=Streptomyces sp. BE133 TaxID=3002523 RepID=UPI002E7A8299|nr:nucleoside-diphosphate kinase [Streptomyces sp. BE133]MEE1810394.1 nucleoside-diphosphate kinase [Streptomyces sp. BE133]
MPVWTACSSGGPSPSPSPTARRAFKAACAAAGHYDPSKAAAGTIRGDLGDDSLDQALAEKRLVNSLVHTSDDADAARRDFGTWFGANRRGLLAPQIAPHQRATVEN